MTTQTVAADLKTTSTNPYTTPRAGFKPVTGSPLRRRAKNRGRVYDAPLSKRLATWLVDSVLLTTFYMAGLLGAGFLLGPEVVFYVMDIPALFVLFVVSVLYYVPQELLMKRTFGKMVCGTMVVTSSGRELTMMHVFGRSIFRLIPFEAVSFLIFQRGWHDSLSRTRVIDSRGR